MQEDWIINTLKYSYRCLQFKSRLITAHNIWYRKIPKISPSKYNSPKLVTQKKTSNKLQPQIQAPGGLYSEIALKFKIKQSKNFIVTHKFLHFPKKLLRVPNDWSQNVSQYVVCVVLSWLGYHVDIDKVLAWLSFRKIYVLKASFSKNLLQITEINFLPTIS